MDGPPKILDELIIASPCPIRWEEIGGSGRARHCQVCRKNVFDVIEMTSAEVVSILADEEALPCVRLCHSSDGRLITSDRTPGVRGHIWRRLRTRAPWAAALFALVFLPGCQSLINSCFQYGAPARSIKSSPGESQTKPQTSQASPEPAEKADDRAKAP